MDDKILKCKICQSDFPFTTGEQQFYLDRVLAEPKRCPKCRMKTRRDEQEKVKEVKHGQNTLSQETQ